LSQNNRKKIKSKGAPLKPHSKEFIFFSKTLAHAKRVLVSTHLLPDGDGLGAETALFHYLRKAKKSCKIINPDPLPNRYRFLDPKGTFLLGPKEAEIWESFDLWVIVDTNDPRRLGKLWDQYSPRAKRIIFLDHHPDIISANGDDIKYPEHTTLVSDTTSSSIGELLYHLFDELNLVPITKDIATGLYVSVMTDTNSFRYARTTPQAHRIAGEMIENGVNPEEVYQFIYSSKEVSHLQLLGVSLQNFKVAAQGRLAWISMDLETRKKYRASADDTQSFLNLLLLLKDAEVICLFREEENNTIRVSLKSKGRVIVNRIAMDLGGGGHAYAAGVALSMSLEKAIDTVTDRVKKLLDASVRFGPRVGAQLTTQDSPR